MISAEPTVHVPVLAAHHEPAVSSEPDFEDRWAAWVARGRSHDRHVRRAFKIWGGVIATGAAIAYAFLRL
jgi:hypothetical protein